MPVGLELGLLSQGQKHCVFPTTNSVEKKGVCNAGLVGSAVAPNCHYRRALQISDDYVSEGLNANIEGWQIGYHAFSRVCAAYGPRLLNSSCRAHIVEGWIRHDCLKETLRAACNPLPHATDLEWMPAVDLLLVTGLLDLEMAQEVSVFLPGVKTHHDIC